MKQGKQGDFGRVKVLVVVLMVAIQGMGPVLGNPGAAAINKDAKQKGFVAQQNTPARKVTQETMASIYEEIRTPYKYGLALAPADNQHKIDCPTVFRKDGKWYMTYLVYDGKSGKDGRGYETWMAESDNLLEWTTKGRVLSFRDGKWDANQRGGYPALPDMEWGGSYELQTYRKKYWMTYIGGANPGYETGPLKIGLAWTSARDLVNATEWKAQDKPLLSPDDADGQWFENITQYKSTVYYDKDKTLGKPFVLFYNAGGVHPETKVKAERIGIALSDDMKNWKRYPGNPVFTHEEGITGDAHIQKMGDVYVMFYFSAFRADRPYKAFNTFACSYDLVNWYDWKGDDLIIPSKEYDNLFAHKSYVVKHEGVVYHFYCAVNQHDQRGIAVATSRPLGRSQLRFPEPEITGRRTNISLNKNWEVEHQGKTQQVNIPHNLDDYYGYRQLVHGNLHGTATYRKQFTAPAMGADKRAFVRLEGVGTYATIRLNGKLLGRHPVGRTTLTLEVSEQLKPGGTNLLEVMAEHPEMISDMPWVCGGCSSEWGFSEGSQPFGIFRPVTLEITDRVRVEPFGVHIWHNDAVDSVYIDTEIRNYGNESIEIELVNKLNNEEGIGFFRLAQKETLQAGETRVIRQSTAVKDPKRWSTSRPYLYQLATMIKQGNALTTDEVTTPFGFRTISWPVKRNDGDGRFYLNGEPVFINGICEYEHQFGQSHAFSGEQIKARVNQFRALGFNAFRDAHQPHHLDYQAHFDRQGILFWTQLSAHIWYDTPEFRSNFKEMLRRWVKERRNSPSVVMWGLQNESTLPEAFARECSEMIREMDPTARRMRVITTCNGGSGTDWNVVQNWSGTYGGKPDNYARELSRPDQLLNGEYGAWRTLGFHQEPQVFRADGDWTEGRATQLLEQKIRLAESVRDSVSGQFQWIYSSHDNPGRRQPDEAFRRIDKVGPFNYKGLMTPWEEPTDAWYMYRSNYVSPATDPMVYLVSHSWHDRFTAARKATIEVYSNCDSVRLYNDALAQNDNLPTFPGSSSNRDTTSGSANHHQATYLGTRRKGEKGTHFSWEDVDIRYNVLRAVGYYKGKVVAEDLLYYKALEKAPGFEQLVEGSRSKPEIAPIPENKAVTNSGKSITKTRKQKLLKGNPNLNYIYRINCGGDAYTDEFGQEWLQDDTLYSRSWAQRFPELNPFLASQRVTRDPIRGVRDWDLLGHFRFGRHELMYNFAVSNGTYTVELYFTEPWHGTGGSEKTDCEGWRIFDVAINDSVVLDDLDIWAESGHDGALKKTVKAHVTDGRLTISFPEVKAGQALISAIAIASESTVVRKNSETENTSPADSRAVHQQTEQTADFKVVEQQKAHFMSTPAPASSLPPGFWSKADTNRVAKLPVEELPNEAPTRASLRYEAEKAGVKGRTKEITVRNRTGIQWTQPHASSISWTFQTGLAQVYALRFHYLNTRTSPLDVSLKLLAPNGNIVRESKLSFPPAPEKWRMVSTTTGTFINAGEYKLILSADDMNGLAFDYLEVQ